MKLASNHWEHSQARHELSEIRGMTRGDTIKTNLAKTLVIPVICFGLIMAIVTVLFRAIP
jgi:hypothetical protein